KVRRIVARVIDTKSLYINNHRISFPNEVYSADALGYSGDVALNLLGTTHNCVQPTWTIHGSEPYPTTVLSITLHGWYSVN
ncbi:MAG: hypothetical protein IJY77_02150, partial [Alphaproteobacteria bacterium]|nr:hypothetical protein [Alphaproteobacteria bacterium]